MREIKFRGKSIKDGKWVYGYFLVNQFDEYTICDKTFAVAVIPETVGQYATLSDKNNKEIYEGDIVRVGSKLMEEKKWSNYWATREVKFGDGEINGSEWEHAIIGFWLSPCDTFNISNLTKDNEDMIIEVIGNIYENPELLNKKIKEN